MRRATEHSLAIDDTMVSLARSRLARPLGHCLRTATKDGCELPRTNWLASDAIVGTFTSTISNLRDSSLFVGKLWKYSIKSLVCLCIALWAIVQFGTHSATKLITFAHNEDILVLWWSDQRYINLLGAIEISLGWHVLHWAKFVRPLVVTLLSLLIFVTADLRRCHDHSLWLMWFFNARVCFDRGSSFLFDNLSSLFSWLS